MMWLWQVDGVGDADWVVIAEENNTLNSCYREKLDWRKCKDEVSRVRAAHSPCQLHRQEICRGDRHRHVTDRVLQMEAFKQCWKRRGNDDRTDAKDA